MVQCGVPAVIRSIPTRIPQLSDPSPRYSRNIHTHTHRKPADSAGFPPSQSTCTPLVQKQEGDQSITDDQDGCEWVFLLVLADPGTPGPKAVKQLCLCVCKDCRVFLHKQGNCSCQTPPPIQCCPLVGQLLWCQVCATLC